MGQKPCRGLGDQNSSFTSAHRKNDFCHIGPEKKEKVLEGAARNAFIREWRKKTGGAPSERELAASLASGGGTGDHPKPIEGGGLSEKNEGGKVSREEEHTRSCFKKELEPCKNEEEREEKSCRRSSASVQNFLFPTEVSGGQRKERAREQWWGASKLSRRVRDLCRARDKKLLPVGGGELRGGELRRNRR